jgi:hypothetical protein
MKIPASYFYGTEGQFTVHTVAYVTAAVTSKVFQIQFPLVYFRLLQFQISSEPQSTSSDLWMLLNSLLLLYLTHSKWYHKNTAQIGAFWDIRFVGCDLLECDIV